MPAFPIVDSHVHLYDVDRLSYGWLKGVPKINRSYGLEDFDRARATVQVEKLVFAEVAVDPGLHLDEAALIQGLSDADARLAGIVAHAPMERGRAVQTDLDTLAQLPAVRGIRRLIETERDPSFAIEPGFLDAVRLLPSYGYTFDICVKHFAMIYAIELARRCPEVSFVLDHIGKPDNQARPARAVVEPDCRAGEHAQCCLQDLRGDNRGRPPSLDRRGGETLCRACDRVLRI